MDNEWQAEPNICGACPIAQQVKVSVPFEIYQAWIELARAEPEEWFAYLLGDSETYTVSDFYFPEQVASSGHCAPTEGAERRPGIIGTVHSHHTMGAFFSGSADGGGDRGHFNWPVEIVVAADGKCLANIRQPLACGQHHRRDTEVQLLNVPQFAAAYREALKAALVKPKVEAVVPTSFGSFFSKWQASRGNTTGEPLQVPLFDKVEEAPTDLVEVNWDGDFWYCQGCDKLYSSDFILKAPQCPDCKIELIEDKNPWREDGLSYSVAGADGDNPDGR